jgi:hypothetical protein
MEARKDDLVLPKPRVGLVPRVYGLFALPAVSTSHLRFVLTSGPKPGELSPQGQCLAVSTTSTRRLSELCLTLALSPPANSWNRD